MVEVHDDIDAVFLVLDMAREDGLRLPEKEGGRQRHQTHQERPSELPAHHINDSFHCLFLLYNSRQR